MAIRIGITGGIGSGKSVVSKILSLLNIPIYLSDDEAKRLTATDEAIRRELTELLGNELYQGGILNKQKLANYLFASAEKENVPDRRRYFVYLFGIDHFPVRRKNCYCRRSADC